MISIRVRHTLRLLCCLFVLTAHPLVAAGQGVADVEASARNGNFQQAFTQSRAVVVVAPTLDGITQLRAVFAKYPQIQQAGVEKIGRLIDSAQTEQDLLGAQSELRHFVKLVTFVICEPGALKALQTRFVAAASRLILDAGIPVTFESNLLADWTASTESVLDGDLERRIYQNTMANIAARDRRDTPPELMTERLFQYLHRHEEARADAFDTLKSVQWMARDLDGAMRLAYPVLAKQRRAELGLPEPSAPPSSAGLTLPRPVKEVNPNYTQAAMEKRIEGTVLLNCLIWEDGTVGGCHVTRSLDRQFGLDEEALKAVRQWLFLPAEQNGRPVATLATIEMTFTLRGK